MRAFVGVLCMVVAALWVHRIARRGPKGRSPSQVAIDFVTGARRESVVVIGLLLFGGLLLAAHFLAP